MAKNYGARKNVNWMVISTVPDVCNTPVGSDVKAVPYPVVAYLEQNTKSARNVNLNGDPSVIYDESVVPTTVGDSDGSHKGVKSGTVAGKCYPKAHSSSVKVNRKYVVRHDDDFWMNGQ
jgi:hypothetical protein